MTNSITVTTAIQVPISNIWEYFTNPNHITGWNNASEDWECPKATNNLKVGGRFCYTMAAKDKTISFDFSGIYHSVDNQKLIEFTLCEVGSDPIASDRRVRVEFQKDGDNTIITESFDPESENSEELQKRGWQSILNNFKKYSEQTYQDEITMIAANVAIMTSTLI